MGEVLKQRRRSQAAMRHLLAEMRRLESSGLPRAAIADALQCTRAQVTRGLGAKREYLGKRRTPPRAEPTACEHGNTTRHCRQCKNAYSREHRPKHNELTPEARAKSNARAYANTYQRRGKIAPRPCENCGAPQAEKHHDDYSKPLVVRWLCRCCHVAQHKADGASVLQEVHRGT